MKDDEVDLHRFDDIPDPSTGEARVPPPPALAGASPTRRQWRHRRRVALCGGAAAVVLGALVMGSTGVPPTRDAWFAAATAAAGAIWALWTARAAGARLGLAATALPLLGLTGALGLSLGAGRTVASLGGTVACAVGSCVLTAAPLASVLFVHRGAFATATARRAIALGVFAGLLGLAAMELRCGAGGWAHVAGGHGAGIVLASVAALTSLRWLRP